MYFTSVILGEITGWIGNCKLFFSYIFNGIPPHHSQQYPRRPLYRFSMFNCTLTDSFFSTFFGHIFVSRKKKRFVCLSKHHGRPLEYLVWLAVYKLFKWKKVLKMGIFTHFHKSIHSIQFKWFSSSSQPFNLSGHRFSIDKSNHILTKSWLEPKSK